MKLSRVSKRFTLECSAILLSSLALAAILPEPSRHEAGIVSSLFESGKNLFSGGKGIARLTGAQACFKGGGAVGRVPGIVTPATSCNAGVNAAGVPIPDCAVPGALCVVPAGCLNLNCAAFRDAIYDPGSKMCGCANPDIQGAATGFLSNFLGI